MNSNLNINNNSNLKKEPPIEASNPKPNKELRKALKEADAIISGKKKAKRYKDVDDLFNDILK